MSSNKPHMMLLKLIFCCISLFLLQGCLGSREINDLEIVVGIAVDKGESPDSIILTAQIVKPSEMGKSSGDISSRNDNKAYWNVSYTGETVFEAARQITHITGDKLFLAHQQVLILGEEIAKMNVQGYIDFFLRANTIRPSTKILVAEGRASDILETVSGKERLPAINAAKLIDHYGYTSDLYEVNLNDFAERLLSDTTSPITPLIRIITDDKNKDTSVSGMAVFNTGRMVGTLSQDETRGLLWILDKVESGIINVPSPNGQGKAALEIIETKSKITPVMSDGKILINIKIIEKATLAEQSNTENLGTVQGLEALQKSQAEAIKREILAAWNKSRELNSDIFGFGDLLHRKYGTQWKAMEGQWKDIYPGLKLNMDVQTKIIGTNLLTGPAASKKGE